jgi:3'-phosphoadenosine 5'-phosphosulfate sulfotransferase (PAPS reductase)/FAD synthetase
MDVLQYAMSEIRMRKIWALYSSGNDSLVSTHYAMERGAHEVLHISTGIGVDEPNGLSVREVVHETCKKYGWPYTVKTPPDLSYRDMVLKHGFPGPGAHLYPYSWLKERAIAAIQRESKKCRSDRIGLITGVHESESARRMGFVLPVIRVKARVWIAPCFNWNALDFAAYRKEHGLEISPIAKLIGMSGECFCGAFAKPGELVKIRTYFPALYRTIADLQEEAEAAGVHCKWGVRPPKRKTKDQFEFPFLPLCVNCHGATA